MWRNWQTRWTQNPVTARSCGFDPLHRQSFSPEARMKSQIADSRFPLLMRSVEVSRRDGVRFGISVSKDLEEVHQVVLLLGAELEIADLAVRLGR
jgi:hypothetical protein